MATTPISDRRQTTTHGLVFVGCFTTAQRNARGTGIHAYRMDAQSGAWSTVGHLGDLVNPSFLITDPVRNVLYVAHGDADFVSAYSIVPEAGVLHPLGQAKTCGLNGAHIALDPSGRFLIVTNYTSGSITVLRIQPDGAPGLITQLLEMPGSAGPHRVEQTGAHPHQIIFDPSGRVALIPDKGLDRVFAAAFDADQGKLSILSSAAMRSGAGPRHVSFHPKLPFVFVVNELHSSVATCHWNSADGSLTPLHVAPTLPPNFFGASTATELVVTPCGGFVYASNRGENSIAQFAFDATACRLEIIGWTSTQGRDPRFMTLTPEGNRILAANEQGDSIVAFTVHPESGQLTSFGARLVTLSPSAIAFL